MSMIKYKMEKFQTIDIIHKKIRFIYRYQRVKDDVIFKNISLKTLITACYIVNIFFTIYRIFPNFLHKRTCKT